MAAELDPFFGQFVEIGEAHHLVAAAIGQDRAIPVHEAVQPAQPRHPLGPRAQHQVIGIAEDDVRARPAHGFGLHRFDRGCSAHGHEGGRADRAAAHRDRSLARGTVGRLDREGKAGRAHQNP